MSDDHKFTSAELPPGIIMFVRKMENGEELATAIDIDASDENVLGSFRMMRQILERADGEDGHQRGIKQSDFTDEAAGYIEIFINATQGQDEEKVKAQAAQCAKLITSLARATTFTPIEPMTPEEREQFEKLGKQLFPEGVKTES